MRLFIDNLDGAGPRNYTGFLSQARGPKVHRKLHHADELELLLTSESGKMLLPTAGARVELVRADGSKIFTGFLKTSPEPSCLGMEDRGAWVGYALRAIGEEYLLDRRPLAARPNYTGVNAGKLLSDLAEELCPGVFDTNAVAEGDVLTGVSCGGTRTWSEIARESAANTRNSYRVHDGEISFGPVGARTHALGERKVNARDLKVASIGNVVNDGIVLGSYEPAAYVKDQFAGDGLNLGFSLSNYPFLSTPRTILEEEFSDALEPHLWSVNDVAGKLSVVGGKLSANGGTGIASECHATLRQSVELGGAWQFQHGELSVTAGAGFVGGLFNGAVDAAHCLAAFRVFDSGAELTIQPFINGALAGGSVTTRAGCRYALSTRIYATEAYRLHSAFYSSAHPSGSGIGGETPAADLRIVLECREIDPADPASLVAQATVLYDDIVASAPATAQYVPMASETLAGSLNFIRVRRMPDVLVRTAAPGQPLRTRLVGALSEGAECTISSMGSLYFYSMGPPNPNEAIEVSYRTSTRAAGRATNGESVRSLARLLDDGVRGMVATLEAPVARSSEDCALAAKAWLDDTVHAGWSGEYSCWNDELPDGVLDIFPGDAIQVDAPLRAIKFTAIVRDVQIEAVDAQNGRERFRIQFADDAAQPIALQLGREQPGYEWPNVVVDADGPPALPPTNNAAITALTSTTMTIDAGLEPIPGGGFEVRRSDAAWGAENDRNLAGRFTTQTFTLPRLARNQQYCIRQYDASVPPNYSRHTTILYVDVPL